jgi:hypothetical protein
MISLRRLPTAAALALLVATGCSNPFAPDTSRPPDDSELPPPSEATTAAVVMTNLQRAFDERDRDLYETLLDDRFWFTETDCQGELILANGKEEELEIMGSRDGSRQGLFDIYREIEWTFTQSRRSTELGRDYPNAFDGDPDGHPDEDWEVFRGRVEILLLEAEDEGFRVDQVMNFKMRQAEDGLWRIVRWIDDPLAGDCGDGSAGKPAGTVSWGELKR